METLKERLENFHKNECTKGYMSNADYQKRIIEIGEVYAEEYHKEKTKSNRLENFVTKSCSSNGAVAEECKEHKLNEIICNWIKDDDGIYNTDCGNSFYFDDSERPSNFIICPYCGKSIKS